MGYDTTFEGEFTLDQQLTDELYNRLKWFAMTRHYKRECAPYYGKEGMFFLAPNDDCIGAERIEVTTDFCKCIDYNTPPEGVPGLWCQWIPTDDKWGIKWEGGEKFYSYVEWIQFLVDNFLKPNGYKLNGDVKFSGEDEEDVGIIHVKNNEISVEMLPCEQNTYNPWHC